MRLGRCGLPHPFAIFICDHGLERHLTSFNALGRIIKAREPRPAVVGLKQSRAAAADQGKRAERTDHRRIEQAAD